MCLAELVHVGLGPRNRVDSPLVQRGHVARGTWSFDSARRAADKDAGSGGGNRFGFERDVRFGSAHQKKRLAVPLDRR
jgi:hypothetical protein